MAHEVHSFLKFYDKTLKGKVVIGLLVLDVPGEDIPCFTKLSITLFLPHGYFFLEEKKIVLVRGKEAR